MLYCINERVQKNNLVYVMDITESTKKSTSHVIFETRLKQESRFSFDYEKYNLQRLFAQSPGFIAILSGPRHVFELVNDAYYQLVGHRHVIGKSVEEALPEIEGQGFIDLLDRVYQTGVPYVAHSMPLSVQRRPESGLENLFVDFVYQPVFDQDGTISGIFCQGHDLTKQKLSQDALHQLYAHQSQIREDERKRIARDIHDHLGQNLLALNLDVSMLHARTRDRHPKLHQKVSMALQNIEGTIHAIKSIINDLRPFELELGLYAAASWQIQKFKRQTGIDCILKTSEEDVDAGLTEEITAAAFRILQESLTNIARHSHATKVEIELSSNGNEFIMKIRDNGVGFYQNERRKGNSFGLLGIQERILFFGGKLIIESNQNSGTSLFISIPIPSQGGQ
jgi:signal transduction histidine kinase